MTPARDSIILVIVNLDPLHTQTGFVEVPSRRIRGDRRRQLRSARPPDRHALRLARETQLRCAPPRCTTQRISFASGDCDSCSCRHSVGAHQIGPSLLLPRFEGVGHGRSLNLAGFPRVAESVGARQNLHGGEGFARPALPKSGAGKVNTLAARAARRGQRPATASALVLAQFLRKRKFSSL